MVSHKKEWQLNKIKDDSLSDVDSAQCDSNYGGECDDIDTE